MVKKVKGGYAVFGKKGQKKLSRTYFFREDAILRLKQIENKGKTKEKEKVQ